MATTETELQETHEQGERQNRELFWEFVDVLVLYEADEALDRAQLVTEEGKPIDWLKTARDLLDADLEADQDTITPENLATHEVAKLLLSMPDAALAQERLDNTPREQRRTDETRANKRTLIQFNHAVKRVLTILPPDMIPGFEKTLYEHSLRILGDELSQPVLSEQQIGKIVAGMAQEKRFLAAVKNRALKPKGWSVRPATAREDAFGTDAVVVNRDNFELRVDVKTGHAFRRAVNEAEARGTLTSEEATAALESGTYYRRSRSSKNVPVQVCILDMGRLTSDEAVIAAVEQQFVEQRGRRLRQLGEKALATTGHERQRRRTREGVLKDEWQEDTTVQIRSLELAA